MSDKTKSKTYNALFSEFREKYGEELDKLVDKLAVLSRRNRTLARLVFVKMAAYNLFSDSNYDVHNFQAKRGKKETQSFPLKEIMDILKCSHRTAQAYNLAFKLLDDCERLLNQLFEAALRLKLVKG